MVAPQYKYKNLTSITLCLCILFLGLPETKSKRSKKMSARAAGLIIYRGLRPYQYLLLKASYPPYHWSPPKGHHDLNETDIEAAMRETREEAGFNDSDVEVNQYFKRELKYIAHGKNKTSVFFLAKLKSDKPVVLSNEHTDFKWVSLDEACELFEHEQMEDLYHAADVHLAVNVPSEEIAQSVVDFSNIPEVPETSADAHVPLENVEPGEQTPDKKQ